MSSHLFSLMVQWAMRSILHTAPDEETMERWWTELQGEYEPVRGTVEYKE